MNMENTEDSIHLADGTDIPDTIVAIATPPGRGGIGIVRLSGPRARAVAEPMLRLRNPLAHAQARFATLLDLETQAPLDEGLVTYFAASASYTLEDVVEIAAHGAPVVLQALLRSCLAGGARLAEPGEFTQRAFLAGRLGLTQAEAVNDLIQASTLHQARLAAAQLGGSVARAVAPLKQQLVGLIAQLEAGVDFAEDDLDLIPAAELRATLASLREQTSILAASYSYGRLVRSGFTLAVVGRPNAGKSSLFNRLLARDRAIVTAEPGTTRDSIAESVSLGGIPVQLVDTAGLRAQPTSDAEAQGIARTQTHMAEADLVLHVLDATRPQEPEDKETRNALAGRPYLAVRNKIDLLPYSEVDGNADGNADQAGIAVSALTGAGIEALRQAILAALTDAMPHAEQAVVTNARQHQALLAALDALNAGLRAAAQSLPHELILLDLHTALEALDTLTGTTTPDDILTLIFSKFCIGK